MSLSAPGLCIFDLDGTLVDSLRDISDALNACLELLGVPTHPIESYRYMVGEGVPMLCQRAIGQTHPHLVNRLTELARARYRAKALIHTRPYPGINELLSGLRQAGVKLAVLSNKPHDMTARVVNAFWPDGRFEQVCGYLDEEERKPSPQAVLRICEQLDVSPARTWMIGDTPTDIQTAHNSGALAIGVTWGFRTRTDLQAAGANLIVDQPEQLLEAVRRGPS